MVAPDPKFLERCAREIPGAQIGDGVFTDGQAIWCGTREVAHLDDGTGELEVRLTKAGVTEHRAALRAGAGFTERVRDCRR